MKSQVSCHSKSLGFYLAGAEGCSGTVVWCLLWGPQGGADGSPEQLQSRAEQVPHTEQVPANTGISVSTCVPVPPRDEVLRAFPFRERALKT